MIAKNKALELKAKILLWDKGLDVAKLARLINRSRTWTSQVLYSHEKSESTRKAIAAVLGEYIWDSRHSERAMRNGARRKAA